MLRILISIGAIQVLIMIVGLLRSKILSVLLGPADFGVVATIDQAVVTVVNLSALSLPFTALKFLARSHSAGPEAFQRMFSSFFRTLAGLAVAALVMVSGLLAWRPELIGGDLARYRGYLAIAILGAPALTLNILFVNTLAAGQAAGDSARLSLAFGAALAAAAVGGAIAGGIGGLYVASVVIGVSTTIAALAYLRRRMGLRVSASGGSLVRELKENPTIVSYSALLYVALSAYTLTLLATRYAVFSLLGEVEAGLLQAQISIAVTIGAVVAPMSNLYLTPLVNRASSVADKSLAVDQFVSKLAVLTLLGGLPFVLFPRLALTVLFSSAFEAAAPALFLFVIWQCIYQLVNVYLQLLIGVDDVLYFTVATCGSYLVAWVLFPVLVPVIGIGGAAVSLIAAMLVSGVAVMLRLSMRFGVSIPLRTWVRAVSSLVIVAGGGWMFSTGAEWSLAGIAMRLTFSLGAVAVIGLGLTAEEWQLLKSVARRTARP